MIAVEDRPGLVAANLHCDALGDPRPYVVDYTMKERRYQETIQPILDRYEKKVSSHYVKMELKKGVLQYLTYLHNKIITCNNWAEVQSDVSRLSATPMRHQLGIVLEALTEFWASIRSQPFPPPAAQDGISITLGDYLSKQSASYLRVTVRRLWRRFEKIVDEMTNEMSYFMDIQPPREVNGLIENSSRTCDKSEAECRIKTFFGSTVRCLRKFLPS